MVNDSINYFIHNIIFGIVLIFLIVIVSTHLILNIKNFLDELKFLNMEIHRTSGEERNNWIKRRRCLFLSLIPFIRYR